MPFTFRLMEATMSMAFTKFASISSRHLVILSSTELMEEERFSERLFEWRREVGIRGPSTAEKAVLPKSVTIIVKLPCQNSNFFDICLSVNNP